MTIQITDELLADEIHQMAFEEGQPAVNGDGYLFTAEEFDLFVERLITRCRAEQPDTVKVSRELAERLCHRDNYTRQMARRELRNMLLAGGNPNAQ